MKLLQDKIKEIGQVKSESILDVSNFLNMQVDVQLMKAVGEEFADAFKDDDFDVYITVEASGIAPSVFASLASDKPLVIIKKDFEEKQGVLQQACYSYTKKQDYYLTVQEQFIQGKKCILIDDFLASGSVVKNVSVLCEKANATLVKTGIVVSKDFQDGMKHLEKENYPVVSLARIKKMDPETGSIEFV
ncbi:MAG: xanthine phosphoribosyltransferase [Erysipelothrix sp.]|nr:xanthine phosphoribosyltransferase [Erysipelothrix sp.]